MSELGPPWNTDGEWIEINHSMHYLILRYREKLQQASVLAYEVKSHLETLFPLMDRLCELTCPQCEKPCCQVAHLWFDFRDLVFLHLIGHPTPESQPQKKTKGHCCYLCATGCSLPRIRRPWICSWYLCPDQTAIIRLDGQPFHAAIETTFQRIKKIRNQMEDEFISVTS